MIAALSISGAQGTGPMAKAMSIAGLVAGGLIALIFALDLVLGIPFGGRGSLLFTGSFMDVGFILCGGVLAYLSWNAMREVK
jgi:hypothetical protein